MKKFYISFLLMLPLFIFSQGENNHWYFGNGAAVNFNNPITPQILLDSQMPISSSTATVSDSNGKLLFYTNGEVIFTREHQVMQDGMMQNGVAGSINIVQDPSNSNRYYVFMMKSPPNTSAGDPKILLYSVIDISQGSVGNDGYPLGIVLPNYKNIVLYDQYQVTNLYSPHTIIRHHNGNSFWVVTHDNDKVLSFLVDASGVNNIPVQSNLSMGVASSTLSYGSDIKSSPEINSSAFTNYLFVSMWQGTNTSSKVFSFNNATGQLTNHYQLTITSIYPTIAEFNKDASLLYIGRNFDSKIFVFDIINSVSTPIYQQIYNNTNSSFSTRGLQRNRYNDIFITFGAYGYLSKILNPNSYSTSSVDLDNLYLQGKGTFNKLPELVQTFTPPCLTNVLLSNPESNINHTYHSADYVTTQANYKTNSTNGEIVMKAGNSITLLPNTFIEQGSNFLATIEGCRIDEISGKRNVNANQNISLKIDLDNDIADNNIELYPNPASDFVNIKSKFKIKSWEIYEMSGKQILKGNSNKINVAKFIKGVYMINILFENGKNISKKVSVN
ncbi:T9SS type A sorting domain-containing protein [Chryseobacterium sp. YIM B08800]|uniref:T9SS type A sorting domain-containing protein n=1 Tax=Chryseobacterium sp. YIM B08800 TaxID=2984136 RepID=UPI00223F07E5|nr:T9SS type A sorting domain-containing protein [Chryseobacterium sp. YIM B08800]